MTKPHSLWFPVEVSFLLDNRWDLTDQEIVAYLRLVAHCRRHLTDGVVPLHLAMRHADPCALDALADADLVEIEAGEVIVSDYLKWNSSRADILAKRSKDRSRKRGDVLSTSSTRDRDRESTRSPRGFHAEPVDNPVTWTDSCPHGAPFAGRNCIECRTGKDIA